MKCHPECTFCDTINPCALYPMGFSANGRGYFLPKIGIAADDPILPYLTNDNVWYEVIENDE